MAECAHRELPQKRLRVMSVPSRRVQTHKSELKTGEREVRKMVPSIRALASVGCPEMCRAARLKQVFWRDEPRHQSKRSI